MSFPPGSTLDKLVSSLSDIQTQLDSRKKVPPAVFAESMKLREETHHLGKPLKALFLTVIRLWYSASFPISYFTTWWKYNVRILLLTVLTTYSYLVYSHSKLRPPGFSGRFVPRNMVFNTCGWETPPVLRSTFPEWTRTSGGRASKFCHRIRGTAEKEIDFLSRYTDVVREPDEETWNIYPILVYLMFQEMCLFKYTTRLLKHA